MKDSVGRVDCELLARVVGPYESASSPPSPFGVLEPIAFALGLQDVAAVGRPAEADAENARIWQHNLHRACKAADRSVLLTAACWRSDRPGPQWLRISAVDANTGGSHVFGQAGLPVRAIGLDTVVDLALALAPGRRGDGV